MIRRGKATVPTESERRRLFVVTKAGPHARRNAAMLTVSYFLGLRAKEISVLKVKHVLDEKGKLREECGMTGLMTKGGKPRVIYLTNGTVRQSLKEYLDERQEQEGILFNTESALFKSQKGGNFTPNTMQQLLGSLHDRAGIIGGRSHSGRRHFATCLISKGIDLKAVATLLGHASIAMAAQYAEDNPYRLRRIVAEMV